MKKDILTEAHGHAIKILDSCVTPQGFYASGLPGGYEAVWARDSMITSLGASTLGVRFKKPFAKSLELLSKYQSRRGQIPNAVGDYNTERRSKITYNSIDSTLWYLIGHHVYALAYHDHSLLKRFAKNRKAALTWLAYQDPNEDGLPVQQPTMDWQDAFPHKYGRTINTLALYYAVLRMEKQEKLAQHIRRVTNGEIKQYLSLYDRKCKYYLPWVWKSHNGNREQEKWFDSLGNLLAIVTGLATPQIARRILSYIKNQHINRPYPCKAIFPPIKPGDKEWQSYFTLADSRTPYHYLNAGVWPFIGGFYVAALVKTKAFSKAQKELVLLAKANYEGKKQKWEFQEWLHGKTGKPMGNPHQCWSAGMYLFAQECIDQKRVPFL